MIVGTLKIDSDGEGVWVVRVPALWASPTQTPLPTLGEGERQDG